MVLARLIIVFPYDRRFIENCRDGIPYTFLVVNPVCSSNVSTFIVFPTIFLAGTIYVGRSKSGSVIFSMLSPHCLGITRPIMTDAKCNYTTPPPIPTPVRRHSIITSLFKWVLNPSSCFLALWEPSPLCYFF